VAARAGSAGHLLERKSAGAVLHLEQSIRARRQRAAQRLDQFHSSQIQSLCRSFRRVLVTARRARAGSPSESERGAGGAPQREGAQRQSPRGSRVVNGRQTAVAAAREGTAEQRTPGGTSAYASGSEGEPRAWQPRGPRTSTALRDRCAQS